MIYTDTFTSMGQEAEHDVRLAALAAYQVNMDLLGARGAAGARSCTACRRTGARRSPRRCCTRRNSVVFDQAENRLHAQKAIMAALIA